ncbi:MAG: hypothetical protein ABUL64_02565 [Singulisphaera sp.]
MSIEMSALPHVYLLTWCKDIDLLYGTTLTFKTLRRGFPTAPIHVVDAASLIAVRDQIGALAREVSAEFKQLRRHIELSQFIEAVLMRQATGSAVFVDPDVCFWQSIEDWTFDGLAAGRLIRKHHCEFTDCLTEPRLHTSLLWIPDVAALLSAVAETRQKLRYFQAFANAMVRTDGRWTHFDTAAGLYSAFPNRMVPFDDEHLDAYDHLFAGTYADSVLKKVSPESRAMYERLHRAAREDFRQLKGCWRNQDRYFESRAALLQYCSERSSIED